MKNIQFRSVALATAMVGLAAPAMAQDFCGGAGAGGQWIGGSEGGSDIATVDNYREQMALVLGGNEYVSLFTLSSATDVRIEAEGRGAGDPLIDLLDANGDIILSDDDSGGNGAARGEVTLDPGTYCMAMQSYDGAPMTAFVRIGRTEHEALTAGVAGSDTPLVTDSDSDIVDDTFVSTGSCGEAEMIADGNGVRNGATTVRSVDEGGFYRFVLDTPMAVTITAENEDADPVVTLYDGFENYISENDDWDGLNARLDITYPLEAGEYCIALTALNDTSLPITLSVMTYDPAAALSDLYARGDAAPPLDGTVPVTNLGLLESRLRSDGQINTDISWYTIDIEEPGLVVIEAISAGGAGDPWIIVYDDLGREVAQNDDNGDSFDSLVAARVQRGTYIVGVGDINEGASNFGRLLFERYVPAR